MLPSFLAIITFITLLQIRVMLLSCEAEGNITFIFLPNLGMIKSLLHFSLG